MASSHDALDVRHACGCADGELQDAFHLPAVGVSVGIARRRVLATLREWGRGELDRDVGADVALVVSELFTNAIRHTDSVKVGCRLRLAGTRLRVEVIDEGCAEAVGRGAAACADDGEGGRGLLLVGAVVDDWGVHHGEGGRGQVVWACLSYGRPARP